MSEYHDDFTDLLGAYALDAVDGEERERLERHLRSCPWCAAEVAEHRETASFLAHGGTDAPDGVWDRILAELSPPAPPMRVTITPPEPATPSGADASSSEPATPDPATVVPLARRSVSMRTFVAVVAAAAVLLLVVGFLAVRSWDDTSDTGPEVAGSLQVELERPGGGSAGAQAVVDESGRGYLVSHDLPDAGNDRIYQLWGKVDGVVLSLGTFDSDTDVVNFQLDPHDIGSVEAFAVTEEQAPGVVASTQDPVLAGTPS